MARSSPPRAGSTDWGSDLYFKLWRRLLAAGVPPFQVLPFCFSDGGLCRADNRIPDPFAADPKTWGSGRSLRDGGELDQTLSKVFVVHLHNRWEMKFPRGGWVERLLLMKFERRLVEMEMEMEPPEWVRPHAQAIEGGQGQGQGQAALNYKPARLREKREWNEEEGAAAAGEEEPEPEPAAAVVILDDNNNNDAAIPPAS